MKKYEFIDLLEMIGKLRGEGGCPWDKEQTHESLKRCLIEESYEVIEAIDQFSQKGDYNNLREELGDVLLQVVMQSQIAKEEGIFAIEDVIHEISEKMIRRHPHVFVDITVEESKIITYEDVLANWEEIKSLEKKDSNEKNELLTIPKAFPALLRAQKVQKKARKLFSEKTTKENIFATLHEKLNKMELLNQQGTTTEHKDLMANLIGELLFDIVKLSIEFQFDSEELLEKTVDRFIFNQEKK